MTETIKTARVDMEEILDLLRLIPEGTREKLLYMALGAAQLGDTA